MAGYPQEATGAALPQGPCDGRRKRYAQFVERKDERITLETTRHRITGYLSLPREGHRSRLSDFLNRGGPDFLALSDVEIESLDGDRGERRDFVAVARNQIVLIGPTADA